MRIFNADETIFTSNGLKSLQPIYCHEIRNESEWYLDVRVPLSFLEFTIQDNIIVVETLDKGEQAFRIRNITVGQDIKFEAWHIGYDSRVFTVELSTFVNLNPTQALTQLLTDTQTNNFTVFSDIATQLSFSIIDVPLYDALIDMAERYNAVLEFDNWQIRLVSSIGSDKGVTVAYGKNLESSSFEENWDMVCTELTPKGNNGLAGTTIYSSIVYDRPYAKIVSFDTDDLTTLNNLASAYLSRFETPRVNYKVKSDVILASLGDTIKVVAKQFELFTDVLSYKFNVITRKMIELEFGNYRPTIRNAIGQLREEITEQADRKAQLKIDEVNGEIELLVRKDEVISSINLSEEGIKIEAPNIALEGIITANGNVKIDEFGNIEVTNGIFNGSVTALTGKIGRFDINADDLVYTSDLFNYEYDQSDVVRLQRIGAGIISPTDFDLWVYDVNSSGTITVTDLVLIDAYVNLGGSLPTPRKRVRSVIRMGTSNGALTTQAVAEDGSLGTITKMSSNKIITASITLPQDTIIGGIVDSGSNSNGIFTKFSDGTMECSHRVIISPVANTPTSVVWTFPQPFLTGQNPNIQTTALTGAVGSQVLGTSANNITNTQADIVIYRTNNTSSNVDVVARGRWK